MLREARRRANLSQMELARRAGVTQSVVSAYESGQRQPALPTLARLIEATGHDIDLVLRPREAPLHQSSGPLASKVHAHRAELRKAAAKYGASNLRLFGSVARGEESESSDVDLLADFSPGTSLFTLARLRRDLEAILDAPVDIVPASDLKPGVRADVERDLVLL
ncbi:helix-turn-helix domain-containing protein [Phytoactinopolyspora halotolerans]|uniref:Helix-turn-helix domain-containing protein n=1 Tax=Phytoactinopolyspora halotolerans TaxID=1981512 RepID=A0A6L9SHQ7_9ACTN|nr:helix-turn-helix domain-containing protein [Phytoactinopolyspora halotolerans]